MSTLSTLRFGTFGLAWVLGLAMATPALASDQVGVYTAVKKVRYEPDGTNPARIVVCGAFVRANVNTGLYFPPEVGYMYFSCGSGQDAMCKLQWADLAKAASTGGCVGFGQRRDSTNPSQPNNNGTIRTALPVASPDVYPLGMGVANGSTTPECPTLLAAKVTDTSACDGPAIVDMAMPPVVDLATAPKVDLATTGGGGGGTPSGCSMTAAGSLWSALPLGLGVSLGLLGMRRRRRS
jgi:hypothetical protein